MTNLTPEEANRAFAAGMASVFADKQADGIIQSLAPLTRNVGIAATLATGVPLGALWHTINKRRRKFSDQEVARRKQIDYYTMLTRAIEDEMAGART